MSETLFGSPALADDDMLPGLARESMRRGLLSSGRANLAQTAIRTKPWPPVVCCEAQLGCAAPTNPVCGSSGSAMSWISVTEYPGGPTMR